MPSSSSFVKYALAAMVIALSLVVVEALWTDTREQESYRNDAALYMMETGNYSVAYQFGDRYLFKPPGTNWAIVLASLPFGTVTDFSGRVPILLLYLLMPITIYGLIRDRFSTEASITAALASVLYLPWFIEKGPIMELDLLFSYFVVLSQATWFYFHRKERDLIKWIVGHLFLAAAFLIKGPPAFLFFYVTIAAYQLFFSDRSTNWWALFAGVIAFLIPTGLWFLSTLNQVSTAEWWQVTISQMSEPASQETELTSILYHYVSYPVETVLSFFPWIVFLIPLCSSSFRRDWMPLWNERPVLKYSLAALPVWFLFYPLPASDIRYILPIYPWLAILAASVLDLSPDTKNDHSGWTVGFRRFFVFFFVLLAIALPLLLPEEPAHPPIVLIAGIAVLVLIAGLFARVRFEQESFRNLAVYCLITILAIKAFHLFVYTPVDEPTYFTREDYATEVAAYLRDHDVLPCLSTGKSMYYYLHQRFQDQGVTDCDDDPVSPSSNWVLSSDKPSGKDVKIEKTFSHPRLETLYLYRKK